MINTVVLRMYIAIILIAVCFSCTSSKGTDTLAKPNVIILYADDLGYGDIGVNGAEGVKTPNIDFLSRNGVKFTDAHSTAATCTPSRYSLLTGNYAFRRNARVLPGDAPLLIKPGTETLPSLLQKNGYTTAVVGKWHLGLGTGQVNWNEEVKPGPLEIGFDYSFLLPSTGDRVPSVYLENHTVVDLDINDPLEISFTDHPNEPNPYQRPTGITHPEILKQKADNQHSGSIVNGISRIGFMGGGKRAEIVDEDLSKTILEKATHFIAQNKSNPFFLYFSFHDIHVPRVPNPKFRGKSAMGPRGDAIAQMDWVVGEIMNTLKTLDIEKNTLIIFTSDNGPVLNDGYEDQAIEKLGEHKPSGIFRGGKYSAYEAGTRVPTISYWPGKIKPKESHALWSQVDIYTSIASLLKLNLDTMSSLDSQNMIDVILGKSDVGREVMLEESYTFGLRDGKWKYIMPSTKDYSWVKNDKKIESGIDTIPQLYNLETDPTESINLAIQQKEILVEMEKSLNTIINEK